MKVKIELDWQEIPMSGYTYYKMDVVKSKKKYCRWWAYPLFKFLVWIYYKKLWIYHTLNDVGIMKTPNYCVMRFSDIWHKPNETLPIKEG